MRSLAGNGVKKIAQMEKINKYIYWAPRIISIIFVLFLGMFSLDVFRQGSGFWETAVGLFMHNTPSLVLLAILIISWKYEIVGGTAFILAGLTYVIMTIKGSLGHQFEWYMASNCLIIAGPAFLIGILFLINWFKKRKNR